MLSNMWVSSGASSSNKAILFCIWKGTICCFYHCIVVPGQLKFWKLILEGWLCPLPSKDHKIPSNPNVPCCMWGGGFIPPTLADIQVVMYKSHLKVSFISRFLSLNTEIDAMLPRVPNMATKGIRQPSTKVDSSRLLLEREVELDMTIHLMTICTFLISFPSYWLSEKIKNVI